MAWSYAVQRNVLVSILSALKVCASRVRFVEFLRTRSRARKEVANWIASGMPVPPPHLIKQRTVRRYAKRYGIRVFVETGTFMGDMVEAMRRHFGEVFSVELSPDLYRRACERFENCRNVRLLQGDSTVVLPEVLTKIREPALFWLDGHYSEGVTAKGDKETPILAELEHVLRHSINNHVILVDDARCFNGTHDYPTISELHRFVKDFRPDATFEVEADIVRIT